MATADPVANVPRKCAQCGSPTSRGTRLCEPHRVEAMERVRIALTKPEKRSGRVVKPKPPKPEPAPRPEPAPKPRPRPRKPKPMLAPRRPQPVQISAEDVYKTDAYRAPVPVRALHAAKWLHRYGHAVTKYDLGRVAGIRAGSQSTAGIVAYGVDRGWFEPGPAGGVAPGRVEPSA